MFLYIEIYMHASMSGNTPIIMETSYFLVLIVVIWFLGIQVLNWFNRRHLNSVIKNTPPPSPPSIPIVGHIHLIKEPIHRTLQSISQTHGKILLLRIGARKILLVSSTSAVEECFTKNDLVFSNRARAMASEHFQYHYTTILAAPYGDLWRNLRRFMTLELLSSSSVSKYSVVREREVRLWVQRIAAKSSRRIEMKSEIKELMFNVMTMITLGEQFYGEGAKNGGEAGRKFEECVRTGIELSGPFNMADFFPILKWKDLIGIERKMVGLMEKVDGFFQDIVDQHRIRNKPSSSSKVLIDEILGLQQRQPEMFTDDIIKGILLVLLTAGTETSASTLEWAMALLLNHPKSMSKLRAEIDANVGHDRLLNEQDLPNLNYLQNVINETHRLYPAVPFLTLREASEDCVVGGYNIPKDTILMINAWAIHRDPELWEIPTEFVPERFESVAGKRSVDQGWKLIPFGGGRRRCPASAAANRLIGLALGCLVQLFDWEKSGEEMIDMTEALGLTMPRANPLELVCTPRKSTMKLLYPLCDN
ncbi:Cytochrome P450 81Q32 [Linum perenne]